MATIQIKGMKCPVCKEWMRPVQKNDTGELGFFCTNCREFQVFDPNILKEMKFTFNPANDED